MTGAYVEYATALFSLGLELNKEKEFLTSLNLVKEQVCDEYIEFLSTPSIKMSERLLALDGAFGGKIQEEVLSFLKLLVEKRKIKIFYECVTEYEKLLSAHENVCHAKVTSAVELTDKQLERLKEKLEKLLNKTVVLETEVDKKLIGGISVLADDTLIDGSIYKKLTSLKEIL